MAAPKNGTFFGHATSGGKDQGSECTSLNLMNPVAIFTLFDVLMLLVAGRKVLGSV